MNDFCVAVMKGVSAIMHAVPVCVTIIMYCTKEHPKIIVKTADKFANYVEPNSITELYCRRFTVRCFRI